jgi:hypothetical protein
MAFDRLEDAALPLHEHADDIVAAVLDRVPDPLTRR